MAGRGVPQVDGKQALPTNRTVVRLSWEWPLGPPSVTGKLLTYNDFFMTAYVYVSLKKSVLDPQGKTIQGALKKMGYKGLESVRQGKYFELTLDGGLSREDAQAEVERIARDVLTNPVIEEFRFSLAD